MASWAIAVSVNAPAGSPAESWLAMVRGIAPDALLRTGMLVILAAPVAGVVIGSGVRSRDVSWERQGAVRLTGRLGWRAGVTTAATLGSAVLLLASVSALLTLAAVGQIGPDALAVVGMSHAALAAAALALSALGAFWGAALRDPLDAAACSLTIAIVAAAGVLVAGALVNDASRGILEAALAASPLVAVASAAGIDIVRMELLYRISPLAQLGIAYPSWSSTCGWYVLASFCCFLGLTWTPVTSPGDVRTSRGL